MTKPYDPLLRNIREHQVNLLEIIFSSAHSPSFPSLHLRQSSFSNTSVALPTPQAHSPTLALLHLCHSSFSNPSFASRTSQTFHLRHLANRPCNLSQCSMWPSGYGHWTFTGDIRGSDLDIGFFVNSFLCIFKCHFCSPLLVPVFLYY